MFAECSRNTFDFSLFKEKIKTTICGPYWRSLVRVYDIQIGNTVAFIYNEVDGRFGATVYHMVNGMKQEKPIAAPLGMSLLLFLFFRCYFCF